MEADREVVLALDVNGIEGRERVVFVMRYEYDSHYEAQQRTTAYVERRALSP